MTSDVMGAHPHAITDYEAALQWAEEHGSPWQTECRLNLAYALILSHDFDRAEALLAALEASPSIASDKRMALQVSHDQVHLNHLRGRHAEALTQAFALLKHIQADYPHVRAHVAITLLEMAAGRGLAKEAFVQGLLAKRLAAKANRPDLDEEASRTLERLELSAGPGPLIDALRGMREICSRQVADRDHGSAEPNRGAR